jgi:hypothetical protein
LKIMIFTIVDWIQLSMFIISLSVFVLKPSPSILKYYPFYFFGSFAIGIFQEHTSAHGIHNTKVTNAYSIADFSFLFFAISNFIASEKIRKVIYYAIFIYALFAILNLAFVQEVDGFNPVNFSVACLITVVLCIYYFFELFRKTEAPSLSGLPAFWITSAILFNVVLTFPMFTLMSFMDAMTKQNQIRFRLILLNINTIFNIILILTNTLYSIGFLCVIRISKSTL